MNLRIKKIAQIVSLTILLTPFLSLAQPGSSDLLPEYCSLASVHTLAIEEAPYTLRYQLTEAEKPEAPLVVFLQGGPGQLAIKEDASSYFPTARMDFRGTGCNALVDGDIRDIEISSAKVVDDWVRVIQHLKVQEVILLGTSYGTVTATMLAHRLESSTKVRVRAVMLGGTLGNSGDEGQFHNGYYRALEIAKQMHPQILSRERLTADKPFGFTKQEWTNSLIYLLNLSGYDDRGYYKHGMGVLFELISEEVSKERKQLLTRWLRESGRNLVSFGSPEQRFLYEKIVCEELDPSGYEYEFNWEEGGLASPSQGFCEGKYHGLVRPYSPARYRYSAPTYYFEGGLDPNTPIQGANEHISSQLSSYRVAVQIPMAGHGAFKNALTSCHKGIFDAVAEARPLSLHDFTGCSWQSPQITEAPKGEPMQLDDFGRSILELDSGGIGPAEERAE